MNIASRLYSVLLEDNGLQQLLDEAASLLGRALLLADREGLPIAHTPEAGDLSEQLAALRAHASDAGGGESDPSSRDSALRPWLRTRIKSSSGFTGYLFVGAAEGATPGEDRDLIEVLSKVVSLELGKDRYERFFELEPDEQFIRDVLNGNDYDPREVESLGWKHGWEPMRTLCLLTVESSRYPHVDFPTHALRHELAKLIPAAKSVIHDDRIIMLISRDGNAQVFERQLDTIRHLLATHLLHAGLSNQFEEVRQIPRAYQQTLNVIHTGLRIAKGAALFRYDEYVIHMLLAASAHQEDILDFCDPDLLTLVEYDTKHKTFFVSTLRSFIQHNGNYKETARDMHITVSTLTYRLKKIQELVHVDLTEGDLFHIELGIKILEYSRVI